MKDEQPVIKRALVSVFDKTGIVAFATFLATKYGVEILSTGGTAKALREGGVSVTDVSDYTGFPECFEGRVKTLHPKVHGGLLFVRGNAIHEARAKVLGVLPIDMVVVNLYPFEQTVAKPDVTDDEVIENIDIGGPSMLRSAAKNHQSVVVASHPTHYSWIQNQMTEHQGGTSLELRRFLARAVFENTARYDRIIMEYFQRPSLC